MEILLHIKCSPCCRSWIPRPWFKLLCLGQWIHPATLAFCWHWEAYDIMVWDESRQSRGCWRKGGGFQLKTEPVCCYTTSLVKSMGPRPVQAPNGSVLPCLTAQRLGRMNDISKLYHQHSNELCLMSHVRNALLWDLPPFRILRFLRHC